MQACIEKRSCDFLFSAAELDCLEGNFHLGCNIAYRDWLLEGVYATVVSYNRAACYASILPCGQLMRHLAFSGRLFWRCHLQGRDKNAKKPDAYIFDLKSDRFAKELKAAVNVSPSIPLGLHQEHLDIVESSMAHIHGRSSQDF